MMGSIKAYVLIKTKPATAKATVKKLREIDGVVEADPLWGMYDAIAVVKAQNLDELDIIVCHRIKVIETIIETMTLICKSMQIPDRA